MAVLIETYAAIAATMPQVRIERSTSAVIAQAPFAHPLCNFGVLLSYDGIPPVLRAASGRSHFNIYTFESTGLELVSAFAPVLAMRIMTAPAGDPTDSRTPHAETPGARMVLARFMAEQFFSSHRADVRERIADATARAEGVEQFGFYGPSEGNLVGAAMLAHHTTMAGLFNVCVDRTVQGRGWGTEIVKQMLNDSALRGVATTLQCDLSLEGWYERRGFHAVDTLTVWTAAGKSA